jgi:hypothetical protein
VFSLDQIPRASSSLLSRTDAVVLAVWSGEMDVLLRATAISLALGAVGRPQFRDGGPRMDKSKQQKISKGTKSGLQIKPLGAPKVEPLFTITVVLTPCA